MVEEIVQFVIGIIGDAIIYRTPSTKRINQHINELKNESWFMKMYEQPHYQKLFHSNQKIRIFIGEKKPKKLNNNPKLQEKLKQILHEEYLFQPSK